MGIPKQFDLAGQTISIVYEKDLLSKQDCVGEARYRINEIALQSSCEEREIKDDQMNTTLYHELVHRILYMMQNDLRNDEKFVELFSHFLYQYEKTKQF